MRKRTPDVALLLKDACRALQSTLGSWVSRRSSSPRPPYGGRALVMLRPAQVDVERLAEMVTDAWRMRAPATLARELGESRRLPGTNQADHATGPACASLLAANEDD